MQNLNRFVTYIYSYREYEKDINVGFAKADKRSDYVRMEMQIRKKTAKKERAQVYLLVGEVEHPTALPAGIMYFENETGTYKGKIPVDNIADSGYSFEQVKGLYLKSEEEMFASQWVEEELKLSKIIFKKEDKEDRTKEEDKEDKTKEKELKTAQVPTIAATEQKPLYDWRYEWEKLDQGAGTELVLGLALWTRNKGKS
ncbi:MAG: hypothetical protein ACI4C5_03945 [Lachnospiraceae bacterium]